MKSHLPLLIGGYWIDDYVFVGRLLQPRVSDPYASPEPTGLADDSMCYTSGQISVCMLAMCLCRCLRVDVYAVLQDGPYCSFGRHNLDVFIVSCFG